MVKNDENMASSIYSGGKDKINLPLFPDCLFQVEETHHIQIQIALRIQC